MQKVNVLTHGFSSANGSAFLFPLYAFRRELATSGFQIEIFQSMSEKVMDCDILIIESKFYSARWNKEEAYILEELSGIKSKGLKLLYANLQDSTTWDHAKVLPYVSVYLKSQVLANREDYCRSYYGNRIYTDYYHKAFGIDDEAEELSLPTEPEYLSKIHPAWNSGMANYSTFGPKKTTALTKLNMPGLLSFPKAIATPSANRNLEVHCRMGINYKKKTVRWQREMIRGLLETRLNSQKVGRRTYMDELCRSKVVLSPFGLGEITLKDFEVFLAGSILLKPDVSHMETWPNFLESEKTYIPFRWDCSDLLERLEEILRNPESYRDIAYEGQARYIRYTSGSEAPQLFCERFANLMKL